MTTHSETFRMNKTRRGHVTTTEAVVTVAPAGLTDQHKASRWYAAIDGDNAIKAVRLVTVSLVFVHDGKADHSHGVTMYTEIETGHGVACIIGYRDGSETSAFIGNDGTVLLHGLEVGTKYGRRRGHALAWLMVQKNARGKRINPDSRNVKTACAAEIYNRLASGAWPSKDVHDIHARCQAWSDAKRLADARKLVAEADGVSA